MLSDKVLQDVKDYLSHTPTTSRVYLGCDSSRKKDRSTGIWYATYVTVVVIHVENSKGCKVFTCSNTKEDYDQKASRPNLRMMNEAFLTAEAYQQLEEDLLEFDVEVHLDINPDPVYGSNCAYGAAKGYLIGVTGREVKTKPEAFAASYAADRFT